MVSTSIAALFAVAIAYGLATYLRRTGMFFPDKYPAGNWDTSRFPIAPQDVTIASRDGTKLHGWLIRSPKAGAPLMIYFHGNAGNITDRLPVSEEFAQRGIMSVLLFDWRGYGKSEGAPSESKLHDDAIAAYDFATRINPDNVIYGESLGGPYAAFAAKHRKPRCVIIDSSFPSLLAFGNAHYFPLGYFAPFAWRTADWLNAAGAPVLVMHGKKDTVAPYKLGLQLYDSLRVPKEFLSSESAEHTEIESAEPQRYYETIARFVERAAH